MDIEKDELEQLLARQAEIAASKMEKQNERYLGALQEDFNHKLDVVLEAVQPIPDIQMKLNRLEEVVGEINPKVDVTFETVKEMAPKVNATFEKVGEMTVDMEITKETTKDHEQRLQKVEASR